MANVMVVPLDIFPEDAPAAPGKWANKLSKLWFSCTMRTTCLMYFPSVVPDDGAMLVDGRSVERTGDTAALLQAVNMISAKSPARSDLIAHRLFVERSPEFSLNATQRPQIEPNVLRGGTLALGPSRFESASYSLRKQNPGGDRTKNPRPTQQRRTFSRVP